MVFQGTVSGVNGNSRKEDETVSSVGAQIRLDYFFVRKVKNCPKEKINDIFHKEE